MRANCVICSDLFDEINPMSAAKCGHVYHSSCLTIWIGQSKSCPQCRVRITLSDINKLYFNYSSNCSFNSSELENEVLNLKAQLSAKDVELIACRKAKDDTVTFVREAEKRASDLQQTVYKCESEISELRLRVKSASKIEAKLLKLEQMNMALTNDLEHLNNVKTIVTGTQKDVEGILKEYTVQSEATKQLATYCTCLKRELLKVMESKNKLVELNAKLKAENCRFVAKIKCYENAMAVSNKNNSYSQENNTPAKKLSLPAASSFVPNTPSSTNSSSEQIDISPLTVEFNKSKFNMCIKTSSTATAYKSDSENGNFLKFRNLSSLPVKKQNDDSIIRNGYNGFGGHSNFINTGIKKIKTVKRKM